jgi:CRISPR/Cas system-associated endonuclease Cas1
MLLFSETRHTFLEAGLEPMTGIFHTARRYRDSFAYDEMEAVRSDVDYWLLEFIQKNKFSKKYFTIMPEGNLWLSLLLTPRLVETIPLWEERINPVVEKIKRMIKRSDPEKGSENKGEKVFFVRKDEV